LPSQPIGRVAGRVADRLQDDSGAEQVRHAVYTIAFENGIDVAKELDPDETAEVRRLVSDLRSNGSSRPKPQPTKTKATDVTKAVKVTIAGVTSARSPR
jgi:hypothetical protein